LAALLVFGGVYAARRSSKGEAIAAAGTQGSKQSKNEVLLQALKDELFQLEMDQQQGRITPEEYAKSKAALGETMQRATARAKGASRK
jgi:hypothetical protein